MVRSNLNPDDAPYTTPYGNQFVSIGTDNDNGSVDFLQREVDASSLNDPYGYYIIFAYQVQSVQTSETLGSCNLNYYYGDSYLGTMTLDDDSVDTDQWDGSQFYIDVDSIAAQADNEVNNGQTTYVQIQMDCGSKDDPDADDVSALILLDQVSIMASSTSCIGEVFELASTSKRSVGGKRRLLK